MVKKFIYNLEFPSYCHTFTIHNYKFARVEEYAERVTSLQHFVRISSELEILPNNGQHTVTAYVEFPKQEDKAILEWADHNQTALNDILLLLSIFTSRDVFVVDSYNPGAIFTSDPRIYEWGGILHVSIPYKASHSLGIYDEGWEPPYNIGFEEGINQIYSLIRNEEWQRKYNKGYFLFLARMAFHRQPLEAAFTQCWTIWEHIFSVRNSNWLSRSNVEKLDAAEKIAFILTEYALVDELDNKSRGQIDSLKSVRNRLIHFGRFPEQGKVHDNAILFIRLTEFVIAKILDLWPSEIFNTTDKLKEFLSKTSQNT